MKTLLLVVGLLLLVLVLSPAGHGAHHRLRGRWCAPLAYRPPVRVVRTPAVARQHRQVRVVRKTVKD